MAKLKDKINELKTQGLSEELARQILSTYEGDMTEVNALLTEEQNKVVSWNQFWYQKQPQIEALATEYDKLKTQMSTLQTTLNGTPQTPSPTPATPNPQPAAATSQPSAAEMEERIYRNFSAVQKDLYNIQKYHLEHYGSIPDIAPIEKLIEEKKMTPWNAYQEYVGPMEKERQEKELRAKIEKELTEKMQNDATRNGINSYLLQTKSATTGEEVTSPLDEVLRDRVATPAQTPQAAAAAAQAADRAAIPQGPSEFELLSDFVQTMRNGRAGIGH